MGIVNRYGQEVAAQNRRAIRRNTAAESYEDLNKKGRQYLDRIKLFEEIGGYDSRVKVLKDRAGKYGVDLQKFGAEGDAQGWIDALGLSGDPVLARQAGRYSTYLQTGRARDAAKTQAQTEIAGGYTDLSDQFRSFLPGPVGRSGASEAVAANYVAGRKQALFDAMTGIDERTATARASFDANTLASIGDTLETMRALDEQKKLARIQMILGGVGAAGALVGGVGLLAGGAALPGAALTAGGAAGAGQTLYAPEPGYPDWAYRY